MNLKKVVVLTGFAILMMATTQFVFAEEAAVAPTGSVVVTSNQQTTLPKEGDMQWAWGEVTNLDNQTQTVTLKYLDYETDQEKDLVLVVDEKTTFENIKDFNELKLKDTISIDYLIGVDNKNIAKNISFEKPDTGVSAPASAVENSQPPALPLSGTKQPVVNAAGPAVLPEPATPDLAQPTVQSEIPVDSSIAANQAPAREPAPAPASAPAESEPVPAVQGQAQ